MPLLMSKSTSHILAARESHLISLVLIIINKEIEIPSSEQILTKT